MANGIASARPTGLQVSPVASIGEETQITPGVQDFMGAFKSGFITVDDITKRAQEAVVRPSEIALRGAQAEQGILDVETIRPQRRELASKQLEVDINNADLVGQLASQKLRQDQQIQTNAGILIPSPETTQNVAQTQKQLIDETTGKTTGTLDEQIAAINAPAQRAVLQDYATTVGQVPTTITVMKPAPIKPFDVWLQETHGEESFPELAAIPEGPNKAGIVDQFFKNLSNDKRIKSEYAAYQKQPQPEVSTEITTQDPNFFAELQKKLTKVKDELAAKTAQQAAAVPIAVARAKTEAEAPGVAIEAGAKIKSDMGSDKELSNLVLQEQAVNVAQAFATKPNPSNQDDIALIYETIKSFDPNAVREGELKLFQSGIGVPGQAEMFLNRLRGNKNAVLRPEERKNILSLGDTLKDSIYKTSLPNLRTYFERAIASGVPLKQVFTEPQLKRLIGGVTDAAPGTPVASRNIAAPGRFGTPGYPKKSQGGNIFEQQPDGSWMSLGPAK